MVPLKARKWIGFRSTVPGIAFIFSITVCFLISLPLSASTYYVSKSLGSDSNTPTQAQSQSTPWAHLPNSCNQTCGPTYTPVAGDVFILRGGDTWVASDLQIGWFYNGSSSNCNTGGESTSPTSTSCTYIGVNSSFYNSEVCGSSWCRPIFNGGGTLGGTEFIYMGCKYCVIDNVEMTGLFDNAGDGGEYVYTDQEDVEVKNGYFHGWSHGSSTTSIPATVFSCNPSADNCVGVTFHNNVVDGSDTSEDMMRVMLGGAVYRFNDNYIQYVESGLDTVNAFAVYENTLQIPVYNADGSHCNGFSTNHWSTNSTLMFNNVLANTTSKATGCVKFWFGQTDGAASYADYYFNNVTYILDAGNVIDVTPSAGTGSSWGTETWFNNSLECGSTSAGFVDCTYGATGGHPYTGDFYSNFSITSSTSTICGPATCPNETNERLYTSVSGATNYNGEGASYPFSPANSSAAGIGQGTNHTPICTTISGIDSIAGTACQSDTTFGVSYDTSNHTVSVGRTANLRPSTGNWDVGAYQYNAGDPAPNPPSGLSAAVQ